MQYAGSDGHNVLDRATNFYTYSILTGVEAERGTGKGCLQRVSDFAVGRCYYKCRRFEAGYFFGKGGAGDNGNPGAYLGAQYLANHLGSP